MPIHRRDSLKFLSLGASALWHTPLVFSATTPNKNKTLFANIVPEPVGLISGIFPANPANVISSNLFDGLITYNEKFEPVPQLATSWTTAADGKSITFHLRAGVKWHDGHPFTAEDVRYSIEQTKASHPIAGPSFSALTAIKTPDPLTVILEFSAPSLVVWSVLNGTHTNILPRHLYAGTDPLKNPANHRPIGTGPFMFKEWVRGSHITLVRNPNYWDAGKPHVDQLVFKIIPDASARSVAIESGEVHYAPLSALSIPDARRLAKDQKIVIETRGWEANAPIYFFDFNLDRPVFRDVRVRQAFAHAIDRNALIKNAFHGYASAATSCVPSFQQNFHTNAVAHYDFDPVKAENLLDAAGLKKDSKGIRLKINHLIIPYGEEYLKSAQIIQQQLKRVGIALELQNLDLPNFLRRIFTDRDFDTATSFNAAFADPQVGVYRRFWSKTLRKGAPWSNGSGYQNPEVDALMEASIIEGNANQRAAQIHQIQQIIERDLPSISLLELQFIRIASPRLQGLNVTPIGSYASLADVSFQQ